MQHTASVRIVAPVTSTAHEPIVLSPEQEETHTLHTSFHDAEQTQRKSQWVTPSPEAAVALAFDPQAWGHDPEPKRALRYVLSLAKEALPLVITRAVAIPPNRPDVTHACAILLPRLLEATGTPLDARWGTLLTQAMTAAFVAWIEGPGKQAAWRGVVLRTLGAIGVARGDGSPRACRRSLLAPGRSHTGVWPESTLVQVRAAILADPARALCSVRRTRRGARVPRKPRAPARRDSLRCRAQRVL